MINRMVNRAAWEGYRDRTLQRRMERVPATRSLDTSASAEVQAWLSQLSGSDRAEAERLISRYSFT